MEDSSAVACVQVAETEHHKNNIPLTRRIFLGGAVASTIAVPAVGTARSIPPVYEGAALPSASWLTSPTPCEPDDALLALISAYRRGNDPDNEDFCEEEFSAANDALDAWTGPAPSRASALAALELARDEGRDFSNSPTAEAMICAAMRFIEERRDV